MAPSLRSRLVVSYTLVIVLTLAVVTSSLVLLFNKYEQKLTLAGLTDEAMTVDLQLQHMADNRNETGATVMRFLARQANQLGTNILAVDQTGRVREVISSGPASSFTGLKVPAEYLSENVRNLHNGSYVDPAGTRYQYVVLPVSNMVPPDLIAEQPALVLARPETTVSATLSALAGTVALSAGVGLVIAIIVSTFLFRWVYRPISRLTTAAQQVAAGDFGQRVPVSGPSEVMRLAEAFNQMATEVSRSHTSLRDFVANASHELKTPLTAIAGFVGALQEGLLHEGQGVEKALRTIRSETQRLQRLVAELLDLSRIEAGQIHLRKEPVDLKVLIGYCVDILGNRAQEAGVSLTTELDSGALVDADFDRLEQVFNNLIDNGLKHAGRSGYVKVVCRAGSSGDHVVMVEDSGRGITAEDLDRVFDRFYRARESGSRDGSGLGLTIVRELVAAHGGSISVESPSGSGARFIVTLAAYSNGGTAPRRSRSTEVPHPGDERILP